MRHAFAKLKCVYRVVCGQIEFIGLAASQRHPVSKFLLEIIAQHFHPLRLTMYFERSS